MIFFKLVWIGKKNDVIFWEGEFSLKWKWNNALIDFRNWMSGLDVLSTSSPVRSLWQGRGQCSETTLTWLGHGSSQILSVAHEDALLLKSFHTCSLEYSGPSDTLAIIPSHARYDRISQTSCGHDSLLISIFIRRTSHPWLVISMRAKLVI